MTKTEHAHKYLTEFNCIDHECAGIVFSQLFVNRHAVGISLTVNMFSDPTRHVMCSNVTIPRYHII